MKTVALLALHFCLAAAGARANLVTVAYEAEASTVVDQPFGMQIPRLTVVRGFFTYESNSLDANPGGVRRGRFEPVSAWSFHADLLGHAVTGSDRAAGSTETFGHTLRINDGGDRAETGDIELGFSIVGGP